MTWRRKFIHKGLASRGYVRAEQRKCWKTGKIAFSKRDAVTAKNFREHDGSDELRIYPCPFCRGWHLTSQLHNKGPR